MNNTTAPMDSDPVSNVFQVAAHRVSALQHAIGKLAKKAAKLGCAPITLTLGETTDKFLRKEDGVDVFIRLVAVTVEGPAPRINGWTFVATLEHVDGECMLRTSPSFEGSLPLKYRTADPRNCDHCKTLRQRSETFVLKNGEGVFKQIGRQCLRDFLGHESPESVAAMAEMLWEACAVASAEDDEGGYGAGSSKSYLGLLNFLGFVAANIRKNGWLSRGKARDSGRMATADSAINVMFAKGHHADDFRADGFYPDANDTALAETALQWARDTFVAKPVEARTDFEHNMAVIAKSEAVGFKGMGVAAYIVAGYQQDQQKKVRAKFEGVDMRDSKHFGEVGGERIDFYGKLLAVITNESFYGTSYLHKFLTREGNVVTWWTSSRPTDTNSAAIEPSEKEYLVTGKVKAHGERNDIKETQMSRCTVCTDEGRAAHEAKLEKRALAAAKKAAKAAKT